MNNASLRQMQNKNILIMIAAVESVTKEIIWQSTKQIKTPINVNQIAMFYNMNIIYDDNLGKYCSGKILIESGNIATAYINAHDTPSRQRFTIAHELGHFYSYKKQGKTGEIIEYRNKIVVDNAKDTLSSQTDQLEEAYANIFAANLLVPRFLLEEILKLNRSLSNIANMFEVSQEMLKYRIDNLFPDKFTIIKTDKDSIIKEVI
jgi:Zn-dependent peptidase ImmA (M78 family)